MDRDIDHSKEICQLNGSTHITSPHQGSGPSLDQNPIVDQAGKVRELPKQNCTSKSDGVLAINDIPSDYVFGSNISSRVKNAVSHGASTNLWSTSETDNSTISSDSVFTTLAKAVTASRSTDSELTNAKKSTKEFTDKRKEVPTLAEVDVITGEEGDTQIIRQHCRAYIFDTEKQKWNNLGAVQFHLNDISADDEIGRSRIIVRLASTHKLLVNTLIWPHMPIALVDARSIRVSVMNEDGKQLKTYLFGLPSDEATRKLLQLLNDRREKAVASSKCDVGLKDVQSIASTFKHGSSTPLDELIDESSNVPSKLSRTGPIQLTSKLATGTQASLFRPSIFTSVVTCSNVHKLSHVTEGDPSSHSSPDVSVHRLHDDTDQLGTTSDSVLRKSAGVDRNNFISGRDACPVNSATEKCGSSESCQFMIPSPSTLEKLLGIVTAQMSEEQFYKLKDLPKLSSIDKNDGITLKAYCHLFAFCKVKLEWIDHGEVYFHLHSAPVQSGKCHTSNESHVATHISIHQHEIDSPLFIIPVWHGLNISMADECAIFLTTFVDPSAGSTDCNKKLYAFSSPEYCAYIIVMRSLEEADNTFQALNSHVTAPSSTVSPIESKSPNPIDDNAVPAKEGAIAKKTDSTTTVVH